jgi:two-component sensor histidine kinase
LTRTNWVGAPLEDVVLAELEPYHATPQRGCRIGGPHVQLPPGPALTLAMIFHELATNAAKHGSLSRAEGRVHVEWRWLREGVGPMLCLTWTEEGGPAVTKPTRRGFGSRLLEQSVKGLGGTVRLDYAPDGLRAEIRTPLDSSPSAQLAPTGVNVHLSIRKTASALP